MLRILLLFTLIPLTEFALLLWIGDKIGPFPTIALVIGTGLLGGALARWQGLVTLWRIRSQLAEGQMPTDALLDGLMIFVAGALLITPGVLTDITGFSLLVPQVRRLVRAKARNWFSGRFRVTTFGEGFRPRADDDRVIDVEAVNTRVED